MRRICTALALLPVAITLSMYFATEHGVFETEPVGVVELRKQNASGEPTWLPGQVAWLHLDGTHIDYPVMQANDNSWYLSHDYYGNSVASGAVFLDYRNAADFSDNLSIIYGHRMNGDLMFADVAKYRDSDFFLAHTSGELKTKQQTFILRVVAHYELVEDDALYRNLELLDYDRPAIVLSTCVRGQHDKRDVLVLAFDNRGELW